MLNIRIGLGAKLVAPAAAGVLDVLSVIVSTAVLNHKTPSSGQGALEAKDLGIGCTSHSGCHCWDATGMGGCSPVLLTPRADRWYGPVGAEWATLQDEFAQLSKV